MTTTSSSEAITPEMLAIRNTALSKLKSTLNKFEERFPENFNDRITSPFDEQSAPDYNLRIHSDGRGFSEYAHGGHYRRSVAYDNEGQVDHFELEDSRDAPSWTEGLLCTGNIFPIGNTTDIFISTRVNGGVVKCLPLVNFAPAFYQALQKLEWGGGMISEERTVSLSGGGTSVNNKISFNSQQNLRGDQMEVRHFAAEQQWGGLVRYQVWDQKGVGLGGGSDVWTEVK